MQMFVLQKFEGSRHEILHDKDQHHARDMIRDWILSLIPVNRKLNEEAEY